MAITDIKSTKERVDALKNIRRLIDQCIRASNDTEKYFLKETVPTNTGPWDEMWDGVQARMQIALDIAEQAAAELDSLITLNGFVFQYQWTLGKRNLTLATTDTGADTITFHVNGGDSVENTANTAVLLADDVLSDTLESADGIRIVVSASGRVITTSGEVASTSYTEGTIKLIRRGT